MAEKTCDGNCLVCSLQQQIYCSAQRTYAMMKNQEVIVTRLDLLEDKLSAFDSNDINPILKEGAQSELGADNRSSSLTI
jgi:hypothetical protein